MQTNEKAPRTGREAVTENDAYYITLPADLRGDFAAVMESLCRLFTRRNKRTIRRALRMIGKEAC